MAELLAGVIEAAPARRRLQLAGIPTNAELTLAIVHGIVDEPQERELLGRLEQAEVPHLVTRQQNELILLVPSSVEARAALDAESAHYVGSSSSFQLSGSLEIPRREARWAVARARDASRCHLVYGEEDTAGRWLPDEPRALEALVSRTLGAAIAYDAQHEGDLVGTQLHRVASHAA